MANNQKVEQRLENMKKFYIKAGELIDRLPDQIPSQTRTLLKDTILGDQDLKELMDGIDAHRPPRIFLIGRTGVGKSSLINAICGSYVARVSDTVSCTEHAQMYHCMDEDRILMDILDTRGIAESESLDTDQSAEHMLMEQINRFSPDVAIMMLNCTHRDDIISDVEFMKRVALDYRGVNSVRLPIIVVVNKCDEMAPSRHKNPSDYPPKKLEKINEMVLYYKRIILDHGLQIDQILPVSSLIDWMTPDGLEVAVEEINDLPEYDREHLEIVFDGRYNIDVLLDLLEDAIQDFEAQMGLRMAARLNEVVMRFAKHLNKIFAGMAATVALTPIPVSDVYVLLLLQSILVSLIASLSGRDLSLENAKEFVLSLSGVAGAGLGFRLIAQQSVKLFNFLAPGAGSAISSGIAFAGTGAIGRAAIAYYLEGQDFDTVKGLVEQFKERV